MEGHSKPPPIMVGSQPTPATWPVSHQGAAYRLAQLSITKRRSCWLARSPEAPFSFLRPSLKGLNSQNTFWKSMQLDKRTKGASDANYLRKSYPPFALPPMTSQLIEQRRISNCEVDGWKHAWDG